MKFILYILLFSASPYVVHNDIFTNFGPFRAIFSCKFVALKGLQNWEKDTKLRRINEGHF